MVYAADRSTPRRVGGTNWSRRDLSIEVPVADPSRWEPISGQLQNLLGFLSGDAWQLSFCRTRAPEENVSGNRYAGVKRVVLLSGGADSAVGALLSRHGLGDAAHLLVSHVGLTTLAPVQLGALVPVVGDDHQDAGGAGAGEAERAVQGADGAGEVLVLAGRAELGDLGGG
jgi:hypothetical protein